MTTDHPSFDNNKLYHGRMDLNGIFVIAKEQVEQLKNTGTVNMIIRHSILC